MQLILLDDVRGLGKKGEVKEVSNGYGRNFLLPRKLAAKATRANLAMLRQRKQREEERSQEEVSQAERLAKQLDGSKVEVTLRVGREGRTFGSITAAHICEAIASQYGVQLDKRVVRLKDPIRGIGRKDLVLKLHPAYTAKVVLDVVAEKG
ncbi:50S ribosomal protein L9 [Pasteuria penetrans]|uniref:50S ribosomal protein L9 n=1 Tax=Pasteuria penetrans TaxID=86005 RepID=UPI000F904009|nr:50S ribosomal protein L9 [Pasteuria penetrans]